MLEDLSPHGDVTTQLIKSKKKFKAKIISNQKGIIGGLNFAKEAFKYFNKKINFITKTKDGRKINKGKVVATIVGNSKEILKSERVALNFLSLISGVATITNKFVSTVNGKSCRICCTRKTLPNLSLVKKYAVKLGGGLNHRYNLSDEILIKDNHIKTNGDIKKLVEYTINCEIPKFPITGDYLKKYGYRPGETMGKKLKLLEKKWIDNNFVIEKKIIERSLEKDINN